MNVLPVSLDVEGMNQSLALGKVGQIARPTSLFSAGPLGIFQTAQPSAKVCFDLFKAEARPLHFARFENLSHCTAAVARGMSTSEGKPAANKICAPGNKRNEFSPRSSKLVLGNWSRF
jgi:hypothetical protein